MKRTADRLFGSDYRWSVLGAGRAQMPIASMAAAMGGNVRVGLEDSLWIAAGKMAESNAQQVRQVRKTIEGLGLEIATPDDALLHAAVEGRGEGGILGCSGVPTRSFHRLHEVAQRPYTVPVLMRTQHSLDTGIHRRRYLEQLHEHAQFVARIE